MFGIDDWIIGTAATSLISGIGNAIEGNSQREDQERKIKRAQDQIRSSIIDEGELSLMLNNTERLFNNRLISTLNTTALKSRGYANAGVIGGAVAGSMEGEKLSSLQDMRFKVLQHNTTANNKIADLEMGMPTGSAIGDFATGFVGGIPTGIELSKLISGLGSLNTGPGTLPNEGADVINNAVPEDLDLEDTNASDLNYGDNTHINYDFEMPDSTTFRKTPTSYMGEMRGLASNKAFSFASNSYYPFEDLFGTRKRGRN